MKKIFKYIPVALLLILAPDVTGQIFSPTRIKNRAKERAENKAESKVNEQVDKGVDKVFDSLFGAVEKSLKSTDKKPKEETKDTTKANPDTSEEAGMNMLTNLLGGIGMSAEPASSYSFDASYTMKMSTSEKGKKNDFTYKYLFSEGGNYMGAQMQGASDPEMAKQLETMEAMVFDFDKNSFFTFMNMNGQKSMLGMSIPTETSGQIIEDQYALSTYTATGTTKSILGYSCEGFSVEQGDEKYLVWISKDRVSFINKYYELFNKMSSAPNSQAMAYDVNPEIANMIEEGRMMMGMEMTDKKGNQTLMELVEIKPNDSFSFSTEGYSNMMDFGNIMEQTEKENKE